MAEQDMSAGYSGTPLVRKLGIKPHLTVYLDLEALSQVPAGVTQLEAAGTDFTTRLPGSLDVALLFCPDRAHLDERLPAVLEAMVTDGMVWVCWPKKASRVPTDLSDEAVRLTGLAAGVVDVKVAAIDEVWSGLKFVRRLADR